MTDILIFGTLGAVAGLLFSCLASGIYAAWHNWGVRRNKIDPVHPLPPAPLWTVTKTRRVRYGNLPPTEKSHGEN